MIWVDEKKQIVNSEFAVMIGLMRYESLMTLKELKTLGIIKGKANKAASLGYLQRLCRIGTNGTKLRSVKRNGVCGMGRFSVRSMIATMTFMLAGVATVAVMNQLGVSL